MKRGDIYWANLKPRSGSEQSGKRPVLVISHNVFNKTEKWRSIIVAPLTTSKNQSRRGPTVVYLQKDEANLKQNGYILCHQVTTIDRAKITKYIGKLPPNILQEVEQGLLIALGMQNMSILR